MKNFCVILLAAMPTLAHGQDDDEHLLNLKNCIFENTDRLFDAQYDLVTTIDVVYENICFSERQEAYATEDLCNEQYASCRSGLQSFNGLIKEIIAERFLERLSD